MTPSASPKSSSFLSRPVPWCHGYAQLKKNMFNGLVWGFLSGISAGWWLTYPWNILVTWFTWDDEIPNVWKNKNSCSKPPTRVVFFLDLLIFSTMKFSEMGWMRGFQINTVQPLTCFKAQVAQCIFWTQLQCQVRSRFRKCHLVEAEAVFSVILDIWV